MLLVGFLSAALARDYGVIGFESTDVIETRDSATGAVRVHFAVEGPSTTWLDDEDGDGEPDFPLYALETAEDSLLLYAALGLLPLSPESDFGLDAGGTDAIDVYMPAFQQGADGAWRSDACDSTHCAGHLLIDHRFENYFDPYFGLETVVPHELFHGIQAAYSPDWPVWFSEGTATWSERQYVEDSADFMGFAQRYLDDYTRPIDRPPAGPVPSFAYGSALFFDFLTLRHDPELMTELLELASVDVQADPGADLLAAVDATLALRDDSLEEAWVDFTRYNLAVGARAGGIESYPYADRFLAPEVEARGRFLDIDPRYFPYAAVYHRYNHAGGPVQLWSEEAAAAVHLELFPTNDTDDVQPSVWTGTLDGELQDLGDLPEGIYYLLGTVPTREPNSISVRMCLGVPDDVAPCTVPVEEPSEDEGCGCSTGAPGSLWALPFGALALVRRRR